MFKTIDSTYFILKSQFIGFTAPEGQL